MTGLEDLYQDIILDHKRSPRNFRKIEGATHMAVGHNPVCGDKLVVYLVVEGDRISDISFEGTGCAISVASASLMTERLKGKTVEEAKAVFRPVHALLTEDEPVADGVELGKLEALAGVKRYPVRVKCATLAWHSFEAALADERSRVKTE